MFSHSFLIADGSERAEPFVRIVGPDNIVGLYGVFTFFVISGFLVTRSWTTRRSAASYLAKRCLRIFPGLIVCLFVCAVLIGPWFSSLAPSDYFTDPGILRFLGVHTLLRWGGAPLPGVSFYPSNLGQVIIGTYWTLRPEFVMYLLVAVAGLLRLLRPAVLVAALAGGILFHHHEFGAYSDVLYLSSFFAAGVLLAIVHERGRPRRPMVVLATLGLVAGALAGAPHEAFALCGSVLVIQLATSARMRLPDAGRYGDLSYGVYLYGWPVQQVIRGIAGDAISWWQLFIVSVPVALACAWLSWHLVERHAIALGGRIRAEGFRSALGVAPRGNTRAAESRADAA